MKKWKADIKWIIIIITIQLLNWNNSHIFTVIFWWINDEFCEPPSSPSAAVSRSTSPGKNVWSITHWPISYLAKCIRELPNVNNPYWIHILESVLQLGFCSLQAPATSRATCTAPRQGNHTTSSFIDLPALNHRPISHRLEHPRFCHNRLLPMKFCEAKNANFGKTSSSHII